MERDGGVVCCGWLIKSPPERKLRRPFAWRRRWFVLRQEELLYFRNDRARKPIRTIPLSACLQVDSGLAFSKDGAKGSFVFDVRTEARTFYLVAENEEEMVAWVRALCSLCGFNETAQGNELEAGNQTDQLDAGPQAPPSQPPHLAEATPPISLQPTVAQPEATPPLHRSMGPGGGRLNGHRLGNEEPNGYLCLYDCESRIPDNLQSDVPDQLYSVPRRYNPAATSPPSPTQDVPSSLPSPTQEVTSQPEGTSPPPSRSDPDQEAMSSPKTGSSQEVTSSSRLSFQCYDIPPPPCQVASGFCGKLWTNSESRDSKGILTVTDTHTCINAWVSLFLLTDVCAPTDEAEEEVGFECYDVPKGWDSPKPGPKNRHDLSPPENYVAMETSSRSPSRSVTMETCGRSVTLDTSSRSSSRSVTMETGGHYVEISSRSHSRSVTTEMSGRWSPLPAGSGSVFGPTSATATKPGTEVGLDGAGGGPGGRRTGAMRASSVGTRGAALGGVVPPPAHVGFRSNPSTLEGGSPRTPRALQSPRTPRALQSPRSPHSPRTPRTPQTLQEGPPVNRELKPNRSGRRPPPLALQSGIGANGDLPPPEPSPITKTFTRPGSLRLAGPPQPRPPSIHSSASSSDSHDDEEDESYVAMQPPEHNLQYLDLDLGRSDTAPSTASTRALEDRVHYVELDDRRTRALQDTQRAWSHSRAPGPTGNPAP
ncbi:GRB2-associated-binding protein 1-like isoform X2 [Lampetra planeri]